MTLLQKFSLVPRILLPLPYELIHAYFSLQILHTLYSRGRGGGGANFKTRHTEPLTYPCIHVKTLAAPVPGPELVDEDTWLEGLQDACGFRFKGLDESALSSLLCFNCAGRPKPLPLWVNPKVVELYAYIDI